jgi:hypothetical protein
MIMSSSTELKCWEIMKCDNLDCLARSEPETPCWEIAKRVGDYRDISNTCQDCVVYMLKKEPSVLSSKELQEILKLRKVSEKTGREYPSCTLKALSNN